MPEPQSPGPIRPALVTAAVSVAAGWLLAAPLILLSGGRDPRVAAHAWLVAHGAGVTVGDSVIRLVPLGSAALCAALVALVARRLANAGMGDLGPYVGIVAAVYGAVAAVLAAVATTADVTFSVPRAAVAGFAVGGLGSLFGAGWQHRRSWEISPDTRIVLRGAARATGAVLGASFLLVMVMLAVHARRAADLWAMLDPGVVGGVAVAIACVLSLPTLTLWAASVLLGPGFALGTDTSVDLTGSDLGAIPGFPTLAALPASGQFEPYVLVLGAIVPVAGIWAGTVTHRVRLAMLAGALAGLVLGVAVGISGGGIGPGRMADAGPPPVTPLVIAIPVLAAGGALGSWGSSAVAARREQRRAKAARG